MEIENIEAEHMNDNDDDNGQYEWIDDRMAIYFFLCLVHKSECLLFIVICI
jgi:hypothetical protein